MNAAPITKGRYCSVFFPFFIVIIIVFPEHGDHLALDMHARIFKLDPGSQKLKPER